ncbi:hypothetical protein E3N88_28201 [Mikania micrantha]|uniref:Pentatricopeptide repeat-containing protein n=1 Tax=Mikania micrantha TaxID=192012 RepID=A0A5N6MZZ2_9ASTR|nr:hypothetical protein E3N88_28201 [Mikania micrantha]
MRVSNVMIDAFVFPILIKSMGEATVVLHGHVLKLGHDSDRYVRNAIMYVYAKCGPIEFARRVFDKMPERMVADWNSMISGYWRWGNDVEVVVAYTPHNNQHNHSINLLQHLAKYK